MKASDIDDLICMPARMAVMVSLFEQKELTFSELSAETGLADGNLHVQTRKLLVVEALEKEKVLRGRRNVTLFRITDVGRSLLEAHLNMVWKSLGEDPAPGNYKQGKRRKQKIDDDSRFW